MSSVFLDLTDPLWLLDLEVGGRLLHFATAGALVTDTEGLVYRYREGLAEVVLAEGDADSDEVSVPIEIAADDLEGLGGTLTEASSWGGLIAAGWELERARVTLRRWTPGTVLDRRAAALRGYAEEVQFGAPLEPLEFTLVRSPVASSRTVPEQTEVIDETTWPVTIGYTLDEEPLGLHYLIVLGYPGTLASWPTLATVTAATPAPMCERSAGAANSRLLLSRGEVDAAQVQVWDFEQDTPGSAVLSVASTDDLLGRGQSTVQLGATLGALGNEGRARYAGWSEAAGWGGGVLRTDRSGPVRGLGEVIRYMAETSSEVPLDVGRMEAQRVDLDAWQIDTYLNEPVNPWEWIRSELFPLAPLRVIEGRRGVFVRRMRYAGSEVEATAYLSVPLGDLRRVQSPRTRGYETVANELTVQFGPVRQTGKFRTRRVLTAEADPADYRVLGSFRCSVSQRRFEERGIPGSGVRPWSLATPHLWHVPSALRTLDVWAEAFALPHWAASYEGPPSLEDRLEVGDLIVLDDPEVGWSSRLSLVERMEVGAGAVLVDLTILTDPARLARAL